MVGTTLAGDRRFAAPVTVHVVDDLPDARDAVSRLISSIGLSVNCYAGGVEFLRAYDPDVPGCVILDIDMPEMTGLEVQEVLNDLPLPPPVIFVSGHAEIASAVKALRAGAIDFIVKPFGGEALLERVREAVAKDLSNRKQYAASGTINSRFERLTPRERQIANLLAAGQSAKQIAHQLGISPKTVDNHRGHVLDKLQVDNPTQLANLLAHSPESASS